ncbi:MAG: hypothetical protein ACI959_001020, partial [Limisphaerales bacterium]
MTITRTSVLLVLFTCAFHFSNGQTIPNGDFEIWVGAGEDCENPQSWDS